MTYLVEIKSFEDLKAKYREWALKLHPDMGGTDAEMQVLNNEYDQLFPVWKNRSEVHTKETADSDRRWFYTQNGWAGKNYKSGRSTKEIAEIIRTYLKEVYSDCKWSVRYSSASMCTSIHVALMEAPYQVFVDENKTHIALNQYYMDREERLVPEAKAMMTDVVELINSYRYDDSDPMTDYFSTNFYYDVSVGKWDKPFKVVYREKKKPDNRQYETVTVKQTKTRKVIKAHEAAAPQELKVGQHIILKTGFTYGCHRGAIYEIVSLDRDRVDCLKMGRKLDKHVTSYTQRGNRFCAGQEKFINTSLPTLSGEIVSALGRRNSKSGWIQTPSVLWNCGRKSKPTRWRKQSSGQSNQKPKSRVVRAMNTPSGRTSIPEIRRQSGWSSSLQSLTRTPTSRLQNRCGNLAATTASLNLLSCSGLTRQSR